VALRVECYAGYRGEETPRRLLVGDRLVEVAEVLERRITPERRVFTLRGSDGRVYVVGQDVVTLAWSFDRPYPPP
jgi:hypothetical protein